MRRRRRSSPSIWHTGGASSLITLGASSLAALSLSLNASCSAGITVYQSFDNWTAAAGPFTTITFTEVPAFTIVTDQYLSLGVNFTDDDPNVTGPAGGYLDGAGVNGLAMIEATFASPITAVAFHHPGNVKFRLYLGDTFVGQTGYLGGGGPHFFSGVTSTLLFDRLQAIDLIGEPIDPVFVDNMYFSTIPAPSAACLLLSLLVRPRRRRSMPHL
ncbi:MAG: hypothetical protein JNL80_17970 [Phycisphaerae bacterium]|jgi:hypothetical protein|nr:hypothetical protein [Phycisphaerae bacterium]